MGGPGGGVAGHYGQRLHSAELACPGFVCLRGVRGGQQCQASVLHKEHKEPNSETHAVKREETAFGVRAPRSPRTNTLRTAQNLPARPLLRSPSTLSLSHPPGGHVVPGPCRRRLPPRPARADGWPPMSARQWGHQSRRCEHAAASPMRANQARRRVRAARRQHKLADIKLTRRWF
jgi:hypothetical protein